jgi:hypothetical protein
LPAVGAAPLASFEKGGGVGGWRGKKIGKKKDKSYNMELVAAAAKQCIMGISAIADDATQSFSYIKGQ